MRLNSAKIIAVVVFCAWLSFAFSPIATSYFSIAPEVSGQWGDTFGALNALFSALAFIGVYISLKNQNIEINRQQDQIARNERQQKHDRFESTFFRLVDLMRELRNGVSYKHTNNYLNEYPQAAKILYHGDSAFKAMVDELDFWADVPDEMPGIEKIESIKKYYLKNIHSYSENGLAPYFRIVYTILRRIDEADFLSVAEKTSYGNLLRSQITSRELTLAAVNGMVSVSANFAQFLTNYRMFKYLEAGPVRKIIELYYDPIAFKGRD